MTANGQAKAKTHSLPWKEKLPKTRISIAEETRTIFTAEVNKMTNTIESIIKNSGLQVCPSCDGDGCVEYFCGHDTTSSCYMCAGNGVIRSTRKQKHSKKCRICNGRKGGCGGCDGHREGLIEWESYELYDANAESIHSESKPSPQRKEARNE
jgi:hypothetical protein